MSKQPLGYRGYISSRAIRNETTPQHVQNLVIRDYAARNKLMFKLSATEYAMPSCYMMLESVLEEMPSLEGVILFSLFMLPQSKQRRLKIYDCVLAQGASLHCALEGNVLRNQADVILFEDLFEVQRCCSLSEAIGREMLPNR